MKRNLLLLSLSAVLAVSSAGAQLLLKPTNVKSWKETIESTETNLLKFPAKALNTSVQVESNSIDPNLVIDDGTRLMGCITGWSMGPFAGITSIRPVDGTTLESVYQFPALTSTSNWVYADGKYYGTYYQSGFGQVVKAVFYIFDTNNWGIPQQIALEPQWYNIPICQAYNPKEKEIYSIAYDGLRRTFLATLNRETGKFNFLVAVKESVSAIAFDANGKLYALTTDGNLKTIDINTGTFTQIAKVSETRLVYGQSLAFDYHTGKLYWYSTIDEKFKTRLNTIDPKTGKVEKISDLPDYVQICGTWVKSAEAEAKAPNTVKALTVDFKDNGSLEGTINVTAPTMAFDGTAISGNVNIDIKVDGKVVKQQAVEAGKSFSYTHNFTTEGEHKVSAVASNSVGGSPEGTITVFCGSDTPVSPKNVELAIDANGKATIQWDAVTTGTHNGYIDASKVTYKVTRKPDNTVVSDGKNETTFSEQLPEDVKRYSYTVEAQFNGKSSVAAESNSLVYGKGLTVPVETKLGDEDFFNISTIFDNDGDGNTWYETWGSVSAYVAYGEAHQADDWMISPPIYLEKGVYYYNISFGTTSQNSHSMRFTMGKDAKIEAQSQTIADYPSFTSLDGRIVVQKNIVIKEAGKYYFGLNHYSKTDGSVMPYCSAYDFSLKQGPAMNAPQPVTDLKGETFEKGELKNKVTFTTPTKDFNNADLTGLTKVELENEAGKVVASKTGVEPGKEYTLTDENAKQGINTYYVSAYNQEGGKGAKAQIKVYAGNDIPQAVTDPGFSVENNKKITFTWGFPPEKGINGGYVDQKAVTYNIGRNSDASYDPVTIKTGLTERTYTIEEGTMTSDKGEEQNLYVYSITPVNEIGEGQMLKTMVLLGKPYQAPFKESFANSKLNSSYWGISLLIGLHSWNIAATDAITGIEPYDEDGGMAVFSHQSDMVSQEAIMTPLFELAKMKKPVLSFYMYHNPDAKDGAMLSVQISKDDSNFSPLASEFLLNDGTKGWKQHKLPLDKYNDSNRLMAAFLGANKNTTSVIAIDKVEIYDDVETDLALTGITAPASVGMNEGGKLTVDIENKGRNALPTYAIDLYADGQKVDEITGNDLAASAKANVTFNLKPAAPLSGKAVDYEVRVNLADDANDLNDIQKATINVLPSKLPSPTGLTGSDENGKVALKWNAPGEPEQTPTADSFEDYEAYAIDGVGSWKFVDGDKQLSNAIANVDYANAQIAKSFQVWKTEGLNLGSDWSPRTGKQCLINFSASGYYPDRSQAASAKSDDWMISPRVAGGTTVKFYASEGSATYGNETFEFMVSYDSQNPEDFSALETITLPGVGWKEYSFELPADARYFAIHCTTEGGFALLIDDIDYTAGYSDLELKGYNVYRDNVRINGDLLSAMSFSDSETSADNTVYGVSAVYDQGESPLATWTKNGGVESVGQSNVTATGIDGYIVVDNAIGRVVRIYNAAGVKLNEAVATAVSEKFAATAGVYVVNVDSETFKVIVR